MLLRMMAGGDSIDYDALTAKPENVLSGQIFMGADSYDPLIGTLVDYSGLEVSALKAVWNNDDANSFSLTIPERGLYDSNSKVKLSATSLGITADKIASKEVIGNITGTHENDSTANDGDILDAKVAYTKNGRRVGTMPNRGTLATSALSAGDTFNLPAGYYAGGKISAKDLASQTGGTAEASDILIDKTAYVSGKKIIGTMHDLTGESVLQHDSDNSTKHLAGDAIFFSNVYNKSTKQNIGKRIAIRYSGGEGKLSNNTLIDRPASDFGDAGTDDVLSGKTFTSQNGVKISGTIVDRGSYQYAGGMGSGNDGTDYYAFNSAPVGYYRNQGQSWQPELRLAKSTVRDYLGISASKIVRGQSIADISGTGGYASQKTMCAYAYRYGSDTEDSSDRIRSFTMPRAGIVYYSGVTMGNGGSFICRIYKNGVCVDDCDMRTSSGNKNGYGNYSFRGTMIEKSFSANAGDVIKIETTHGSSSSLSIMVATIVY